MKVGILSMQRILNYGSFLQALSLKNQIEARGHIVYFVDILPGKQIVSMPSAATTGGLLRKVDRYALKRIENFLLFRKMKQLHTEDQTKYLEIEKTLPVGEMLDLLIIGSDEVFNATAPSRWGFSTQLFGNAENAKRVVTYAASCGSTTYESAQECQIIQELAVAMGNLKAISVRDQNTAEFVEKITGKKPLLHVDPVFISDFDAYIPAVKTRKPYLLIYAYANRITDEKEIAAIRQYAKTKGLEILCVGMQQRWCKHNIAATGFELLAYVKNAACVLTDTFHGTVFSIKYNKQFATLVRQSNRNKLGGLLAQFDLKSRSVEKPEQLLQIMDTPINFAQANKQIQDERIKAYAYLDEVLKEEETV